jgi:hypothetical protein
MSETPPRSGSWGERPPPPTFFDPSFERLPAPVAGESAQPGPVLLLFDPAADRAWSADAAVAVATGWHAAGQRTVLADLGLDDPFLHERIGVPNQDGVVDVFLYGASLARSARPVPGRGFYLISAGTYEPDTAAILGADRWEKIVQGFREARAALLLFVPADAPGLDALARTAPDVIVLAPSGPGGTPAVALPPGTRVRAWLAPPGGAAAPPPPAPPAAVPSPFPEPEARKRPAAPPPPTEPAPPVGETVDAPAQERIPVPEPGWEEVEVPAAPRRRRRVSPVLLIFLLLALVAAATVAALQYYPEVFRRLPAPGEPTAASTPQAPRPSPDAVPAGDALPYSVQIVAFDDLGAARRQVEDFQRRFPAAQFFIVPEEVGGRTYYRVLAGMAADSVEAHELRRSLDDAGIQVDPAAFGGEWAVIQERPMVVQMGEYLSREAAAARADSLQRAALPAYVVPVPYSDGIDRWRVYGGAYADSAAAEPLRRRAEEVGASPELVERTGRPPAAPK